MLRQSALTLWYVKKNIDFKYSQIVMKTVDMNEKSWKNQSDMHTKLLLSH